MRRWIHRDPKHGTPALADRPRPGRPRIGSSRPGQRILRLLDQPRAGTIRRIWQQLGCPAISLGTLHRRVREVACWRRPRLVAKGDPDPDQVLAELDQQPRDLPAGAVVLAEDETHVHLLPRVRSTWIANGQRQRVMTQAPPAPDHLRPGRPASGRFVSQVCRKAVSASFIGFCEQLQARPAPAGRPAPDPVRHGARSSP